MKKNQGPEYFIMAECPLCGAGHGFASFTYADTHDLFEKHAAEKRCHQCKKGRLRIKSERRLKPTSASS